MNLGMEITMISFIAAVIVTAFANSLMEKNTSENVLDLVANTEVKFGGIVLYCIVLHIPKVIAGILQVADAWQRRLA